MTYLIAIPFSCVTLTNLSFIYIKYKMVAGLQKRFVRQVVLKYAIRYFINTIHSEILRKQPHVERVLNCLRDVQKIKAEFYPKYQDCNNELQQHYTALVKFVKNLELYPHREIREEAKTTHTILFVVYLNK